ncbi:MAG: Mu-like prophage major head subunit gpT family protein [Rhodobacteraceae bacterium]|nr:Mu-like prophage major head subunit gpT family protein [Paracoccaceae bacterium]
MALITPALLTALNTGLKKSYQDAYAEMRVNAVFERVSTTVPSGTTSTTYGWLGDFPALQEWVGDRVIKDMKAAGYEILNKLFEATVGVKRTDIEDDQYGHYAPLVASMGQEAAQHPDKMIAALIAAGDAATCYDGQYFFDIDHPVYPNHDGTGVAASVSNYDDGGGSPGPAWYLLDTRKALRPFIFQERTRPEFTVLTDPKGNDQVFMKDQYLYGIRYRCNAGFGFWQMAYCSKGTLDAAGFAAARLAMRKFTADGGRPLGINPNIIMVSPDNEAAARALFETMLIGGGNSNPHYKAVEIIVNPWLP